MPPRSPRPARSILAWCAFGVGVVPTGCGQLVAPVLALMAWMEIRSSRGPMRGKALALAGVAASAAWCAAFVAIAERVVVEERAAVVQRDMHADACAGALRRVAEGWAAAQAMDAWALEQLRPDAVLGYLVEQGFVDAADLCCPALRAAADAEGAGAATVPASTVRFMAPLPADVVPPDRCIVLFEDESRHRRDRGKGRHVLFADGHVDWLLTVEFRDALAAQQIAAAGATRR